MAALRWTDEATQEMAKVPFFVRGIAKRAVVRYAEEHGLTEIDLEAVNAVRAARKHKS